MWTKEWFVHFEFSCFFFQVLLTLLCEPSSCPCQSAPRCCAPTAIYKEFLVFACVFAQHSFAFEFLSLLPRSFYFSSKYSAKRLFLINYILETALHSMRHESSGCFSTVITLCFCCPWPFVVWTSCGQQMPWEGQSCSVNKMIGGMPNLRDYWSVVTPQDGTHNGALFLAFILTKV